MIAHFPSPVEYKRNIPRRDKFRVPMDGRYGRIKHPALIAGYEPPPYAVPAIYRGGVYNHKDRFFDYVPLPAVWQFYIKHGLNWASDGLIPEGGIYASQIIGQNTYALAEGLTYAYVNLIQRHRGFTDSAAPEVGFCDVVTGRNPGERMYEWLCRTCNGNLVKILRDWGKYYIVEALDIYKLPPKDFPPHLVHWATEIRPDGILSNFPQLETLCNQYGYNPVGTPIPFLSLGGEVWLPKADIELVTGGELFDPYVRI